MQNILGKILFYAGAMTACTMMAFTTGCASGGFKLTREYARFVNSKHIVIRIILYILTAIVFAVTMLIDMVINNTIDFWQGRVSANTYEFHENDKTFIVQHEILPETNLKRSTIKVMDADKKLLQTVVLKQTSDQQIELLVDGVLRTKVENIYSIPQLSSFDKSGKFLEQKNLSTEELNVAAN